MDTVFSITKWKLCVKPLPKHIFSFCANKQCNNSASALIWCWTVVMCKLYSAVISQCIRWQQLIFPSQLEWITLLTIFYGNLVQFGFCNDKSNTVQLGHPHQIPCQAIFSFGVNFSANTVHSRAPICKTYLNTRRQTWWHLHSSVPQTGQTDTCDTAHKF